MDDLKKLQEINHILSKLVDGTDLNAKETERLFKTIFTYDTEGHHLAVTLGAIHAKGETSDELLGFINAHKALAAKLSPKIDINKTTDLSGTGGGSFKSINVSTAASFVVAAAGYNVLKAAYFAVTSPTGSADIFKAFGVDIKLLTKASVENALERMGICPFNVAFISPGLTNRGRIVSRILGERQIHVRTPFHLATNTFSPLPLKYRVYGCYSEQYLDVLAELFTKLGMNRSMVVHANIGLPEFSNVGTTLVVEQNGIHLKRYILKPANFGIKEAKGEDIQTGGKEQNIQDFVEILQGINKGPKADLVAINAGMSLYTLNDASSIKKSVEKAKSILETGEAFKKFDALVRLLK